MRIFARLGTAVAVAAALVGVTTGTASAAPPNYKVDVNHSSGTLASSVYGDLAWSTSHRSVSFTNTYIYVRGGEHAQVTWTPFQGATQVGSPVAADVDQREGGNITVPAVDFGLSTTTPGGIDHVVIRMTDVEHKIGNYANCYVSASVCQYP